MSSTMDLCKPYATGFRNATRIQQALTASIERRALAWLARRTPARISPDHLTALGLAAQFMAGASYALARWNHDWLLLATFFIAVNWLGDSLDGTLARHRCRLRPRYGFYVDHMVDTSGALLSSGSPFSGDLHWQSPSPCWSPSCPLRRDLPRRPTRCPTFASPTASSSHGNPSAADHRQRGTYVPSLRPSSGAPIPAVRRGWNHRRRRHAGHRHCRHCPPYPHALPRGAPAVNRRRGLRARLRHR